MEVRGIPIGVHMAIINQEVRTLVMVVFRHLIQIMDQKYFS